MSPGIASTGLLPRGARYKAARKITAARQEAVPDKNPIARRFNCSDANPRNFYENLNVPPHKKIYLEDLDHDLIAKKTGSKLWNTKDAPPRDNKLTRILKEGGVVVINIDNCEPKDLLVWNSIEAFHKEDTLLQGIGPDTIISKDCRIVFVSENPLNQQGSDFLSRGLEWDNTNSPLMSPKTLISKDITIEESAQCPIDIAPLNVQHASPDQWKDILKEPTIKNSSITCPNLHFLDKTPKPTQLYITGVKPDFDLKQFPESLKKFLSKQGIEKIIIVKEKLTPLCGSINEKSKKEKTMYVDEKLLHQLFNAVHIENQLLSLSNALLTTTEPLHLHVVSDIPDQQGYQLHKLCENNTHIRISKDKDGATLADVPTNSLRQTSEDLSMVISSEDQIQFDHINKNNNGIIVDLEYLIQNENEFFYTRILNFINGIMPSSNEFNLGRFTHQPHALISELKKGTTVTLYVEDPKEISTDLQNLCQDPPIACINGEIQSLSGRVIIKSLDALKKEDRAVETDDDNSRISSLEDHHNYYKNQLEKCLKDNNFVKIHGGFASGKSYLASKLEKTYHLPPVSGTTSAEDILKNNSFKTWAKNGGNLVIDEYNLANEGVFDFLKASFDVDGEFVTLNDNHKVIFLGNGMNEEGRNSHSSLGCRILNIEPPNTDHVIDHCRLSTPNISTDEKNRLNKKYEASQTIKSMRDIQTYAELRKQGVDEDKAGLFVFDSDITLDKIGDTVNSFLDYIEKQPCKLKDCKEAGRCSNSVKL